MGHLGTILIGIHGLNENSNGLTRYIENKGLFVILKIGSVCRGQS